MNKQTGSEAVMENHQPILMRSKKDKMYLKKCRKCASFTDNRLGK